jgi:hypothetical protein
VLCLVEIENDLMPTIHVAAEVSREELLKAVEQLSPQELEQFIAQVLSLRARRRGCRPRIHSYCSGSIEDCLRTWGVATPS